MPRPSLPLLLSALLVVSGPVPSAAQILSSAAAVMSIGDGDTIRVRQVRRLVTVRLACVDAPETVQHPYEPAARQPLQQLLPVGSSVSLRVETTDRYGRTVAEVFREGRLVNLAMVRDGSAFGYRRYLAR